MLKQKKDIDNACRDGNVVELREALGSLASYDLNEPNEEGLCPINIAVLYNNASTAQNLLKELFNKGANVNTVDKRSGDSILHLCLSYKSPDISRKLVPFLLKNGCSGLTKNYAGKSALDVAKDNGYFDLELFIREFPHSKHVLEYYTPEKEQKLVLLHSEEEYIEEVKNVNNDSLIEYIKLNDLQNIKRLLEEGVNPNLNETNKYMPIHYAVSKGQPDPISILELLQNFKAQIELKTEENDTVLTLAIKKIESEILCLQVVEYLKGCGISISEKDNDGNDSVTLARLRHFDLVVNLLSNINEFNGPYHAIHNICRNRNLTKKQKVSTLENPYFKNNVFVDLRTKLENETCLHIACRNNEEEIVRYLLSKDSQVRVSNKKGETPLSITKEITKNVVIEHMLIEADKKQNPQINDRKVEPKVENEPKLKNKRCTVL